MNRSTIYDRLFGRVNRPDQRQMRIEAFLKGKQFNSFLDIGCGDGVLTRLFADRIGAKDVCGIEISQEGAALARSRGVNCVQSDMDRDAMPFEGKQFDFIYCGEVIEHVFDTDALVEYIVRSLKPGGHVLITTPNLAAWYNRIQLALGYNPFWCSPSMKHHQVGKMLGVSSGGAVEHIRFFTYRAFRDLLNINGLRIEAAFGYGAIPNVRVSPVIISMISVVERFFAHFPGLATMVGLYCVKPEKY